MRHRVAGPREPTQCAGAGLPARALCPAPASGVRLSPPRPFLPCLQELTLRSSTFAELNAATSGVNAVELERPRTPFELLAGLMTPLYAAR